MIDRVVVCLLASNALERDDGVASCGIFIGQIFATFNWCYGVLHTIWILVMALGMLILNFGPLLYI